MKKRFEIIHNIPTPYRLYVFNEMWHYLRQREVDFHVHFMARWSRGRPEGWKNPRIDFPHTYWMNIGFGTHFFNPGLLLHLRICKPDWLFVGSPYDTLTSIVATWFCKAKSSRVAWCEGNAMTPGSLYGLKGKFKRAVYSHYEYAAVPGAMAVKYLQLHQDLTARKMPEPNYLPNLIDASHFQPRECWDQSEIDAVRRRLGVNDDKYLCIIPARLVPVKGLMEFVSAVSADVLSMWKVLIVGDGPLRQDLINAIAKKGLERFVVLANFVPYSEMPLYYAASDLFLLPSRQDMNPLSVVEALHSGLPLALSEVVGNLCEAVSEGENGWVLPVGNTQAYVNKLREVFSASRDQLRKMGRRSKLVNAKFWNAETSVPSFLEKMISEREDQ